jgi:hypothetical protein
MIFQALSLAILSLYDFLLRSYTVAYPGFFFGGGGGSTNVVAERGQREWGSGGRSPLVRGSTQFANE